MFRDNTYDRLYANHRPIIATTQIDQTWKLRAERISQPYTTNWRELVSVQCR
ncbi:MAG: DUF4113 domain-containing protein [Methylobacter sp.]